MSTLEFIEWAKKLIDREDVAIALEQAYTRGYAEGWQVGYCESWPALEEEE